MHLITPAPLHPRTPAARYPKAVILAAAAALVIVVVIALLLAGVFRPGSAETVKIVSPETGATIRGPEVVRVYAENSKHIERIIYLIDGIEVASAEYPPYDVTLDPDSVQLLISNLESGNHILTVTVEDRDGDKRPQPDTVVLAFDMSIADSGDGQSPAQPSSEADRETQSKGVVPGRVDCASLSRNLAAQISGKSWYVFEAEFSEQIRLRTDEYRINMITDARRYRREIGNAFSAKGLPLPFGFVMAISQSKFRDSAVDATTDRGIGFWRVPRQVAIEQGYISADESASALDDPKRSAEIAAAYMKELINVFGLDDFIYAIACFGMPVSQAAQVRVRLEESDPGATARRDFWGMVRRGAVPREGADRVARFFAAGIVGENPKAFGLDAESLSSMY
ncbi:MAG: Ig-like domain-containing protein [Blastocatellia bacterium]|nr:Ig-like domain-containing protein [Blastocatellia bacterium]